jgi:hypothetical protein
MTSSYTRGGGLLRKVGAEEKRFLKMPRKYRVAHFKGLFRETIPRQKWF